MKKFLIIFYLLLFISPISLNNSKATSHCNPSCVKIDKFMKKKDGYFNRALERRIKSVKSDLMNIQNDFEKDQEKEKKIKLLSNGSFKDSSDFFMNSYLDEYNMPKVRAKKATKEIFYILEKIEDNQISKWNSGYYKGFVLPLNTFKGEDQKYCRIYAEAILKRYHYNIYKNTACRNSDGNWVEIDYNLVIKDKYKRETLL